MVALRIERVAMDAAEGRNLDQFRAFQEWFKGLQPEAIGPLFHNLISEPIECEGPDGRRRSPNQMLKTQQNAILQCNR